MVPSETGPYQYINHFRLCFAGAKAIQPSVLASLGIRQNGLAVWVMMNLDDFFYHEYVQKGVSVSHVRLDAHAPTGLMAKRFNPSSEQRYSITVPVQRLRK